MLGRKHRHLASGAVVQAAREAEGDVHGRVGLIEDVAEAVVLDLLSCKLLLRAFQPATDLLGDRISWVLRIYGAQFNSIFIIPQVL